MDIKKPIFLIALTILLSCTKKEKGNMSTEDFKIINQYLLPNDLQGVRRWLFLDNFSIIGHLKAIKEDYENEEFLILTCAHINDSSTRKKAYDVLSVDLEYNINKDSKAYNKYGIKKSDLKATLIQVSKQYIEEKYSQSFEKEVFAFKRKMTTDEEFNKFVGKIEVLKKDPKNIFLLGIGNKNEIPKSNTYQLLPNTQ